MFNKNTFINRRQQLHQKMDSGIGLFLGNKYVPYNYPANPYKFRQDSSFRYFFGLNLSGYAGLMDFDSGEDIVFADDIDIEDIIWMGPQPAVKDLAASVGVEKTIPFGQLNDYIQKAISQGRTIHFLPPYRAETKLRLAALLKGCDYSPSESLIKSVIDLRLIKDQVEIEHLDEIMAIGYEMHVTAMLMAKEGIYEREIVGAMEGIAASYDGAVSFPIILSKHGEILHNENHENLLKNGDLLLVDAGFDSPLGYATDHTRTFPVSGKYSEQQKNIYEIVLAANDAVHQASKPGIQYKEMHFLACKIIADGLINLGIMKGNVEDAVANGAHTLFMPHGLGHAMGMDVHDMEGLGETLVGYGNELQRSKEFGTAYLRFARTLKEGHVITNEPGIYFIPALIEKWKSENINTEFINFKELENYLNFGGVRLEDDMLITKDGSRNLGKERIPIYLEEIEKIVGGK